jgi:hypothetical protein
MEDDVPYEELIGSAEHLMLKLRFCINHRHYNWGWP